MPLEYRIDKKAGIVYTTATGIVTDTDVIEHKHRLLQDPDFTPGLVELSDLRGMERLEVSPVGIQHFASFDESEGTASKLALVANEDLVFGMARMYGARTDPGRERVRVFRTLSEARSWLGLDGRDATG